MWLTTAVVWVMAGGALASGADGVGIALTAAAALLATLVYVYRRRQPLAYRIEPDGLVIVERSGERRFRGPIDEIRAGGLGLRVWGSGGLYGYLGRLRLNGRTGPARAHLSDLRRVAIVRVGDVAVAVSPADLDGFLRETADA